MHIIPDSAATALPPRSPTLIAATAFAARPPPIRSRRCSASIASRRRRRRPIEPGRRRGRRRDPRPLPPPGRRLPHQRGARHDHHRHAEHLPLSRARQRQGDALRHRRRPRRLHLGGHADHRPARPSGRTGHRRQRCSQRQPYLPRFMAGGPGNPLGARAMYLGSTVYRIHGTNAPYTIGQRVSSGCIRLTNEDVDRPLQPRQRRHQGGGAADQRRPPRRRDRTASTELADSNLQVAANLQASPMRRSRAQSRGRRWFFATALTGTSRVSLLRREARRLHRRRPQRGVRLLDGGEFRRRGAGRLQPEVQQPLA